MAGVASPGAVHERFVAWATKDQGVVIRGIAPAQIPGRGLGLVATQDIEAGTTLVDVPARALLTTDSVPEAFAAMHGDISVHGLLASFLANSAAARATYAPWIATWPSWEDFSAGMPLLWPAELFAARTAPSGKPWWPVPCPIGGAAGQWTYNASSSAAPPAGLAFDSTVAKQRRKLDADLTAARAALPDLDERTFTHMWLVVNTRSFYWDVPLRRVPLSHEDHMILCPVADYFNHGDAGCGVQYDADGYCVVADRDYLSGEELFVSYGAHASDLMLAEYGFAPAANAHESLSLDAFVLRTAVDTQARRLREAGYLGEYTLFPPSGRLEVCHRTQVAVRAVTMGKEGWEAFAESGVADEAQDAEAERFLGQKVLRPFAEVARTAWEQLADGGDDDLWADHGWWMSDEMDWRKRRARIRDTLRVRWRHMADMLEESESAAAQSLGSN